MDLATRFRAALLQAGPDAALSHTSALEAYGLLEGWVHDEVHVAVPRGGAKGCVGVCIHERCRTPVDHRSGLAVVAVKEAIVRSAAYLPIEDLRFPAMQAVHDGLLSASDLADLSHVPHAHAAAVRLMGEEALAGAESGGEANYYRLLLTESLPVPRLQVWVSTHQGRRRVDALWEPLALGCEIDGERYHGDKQARSRDRVRRNAIQAGAIKPIDFSVDEVMRTPGRVVEDTAANLIARAAELGLRPWWL